MADWLSLCSARWNDWVLACREWAGQFYIYTYIIAIVMLCVCVSHVHCVCLNMQIRSGNAFDFVRVLVSVHVPLQLWNIQMSAQPHSVSVIETVGVGLR